MIQKVAVIGAGTMGAAIAQHFMMKDLQTVMVDIKEDALEKGRNLIDTSLGEAEKRRIITPEQRAAMVVNLTTSTDFSAIKECDLVIEAVFENTSIKHEVFKAIENEVSAHCLIATNTSSFSVTALAQGLKTPERFIGVHYFFHAAKNKLVEIIPGKKTDPTHVSAMLDFYSYIDKLPIIVGDTAGFAINRFFVPWLNEAVRLYEEGMGSPADIDAIACETFAIGMGPFALMNATGVPIAYHAAEGLAANLGPFYAAAKALKKQTESGQAWDIGDATLPCEHGHIISDRLLGVSLGVAAQLVSEGVATATDTDLGARIGLRWAVGPFEMIANLSMPRVRRLVENAFQSWDLATPSLLNEDHIAVEVVSIQREANVGYLIFNRPDSMNALSPNVMAQLAQQFKVLETDPSIEKIIFSGVGKSFVAGADIKFFIDNIDQGTLEEIVTFTSCGQELLNIIENSGKETIAYLDGLTLGGGLELALACDHRIATTRALLAFPETGIGIYPGLGGTQRTPRLIGRAYAKYLIATGKMLNAKNALRFGLVNTIIDRVVNLKTLANVAIPDLEIDPNMPEKAFASFNGQLTDDQLDQAIFQKSERQIKSKAPIALKKAMMLIDEGQDLPLIEALDLELEGLKEIFSTADAHAGLSSVMNRQRPQFTGA